jgi:hypothetical protein
VPEQSLKFAMEFVQAAVFEFKFSVLHKVKRQGRSSPTFPAPQKGFGGGRLPVGESSLPTLYAALPWKRLSHKRRMAVCDG